MEIKLTKKRSHYVMKIPWDPRNYGWDKRLSIAKTWDEDIESCEAELRNYPGVKRMSYDEWFWDSKNEAQHFITYFTLKYSNE